LEIHIGKAPFEAIGDRESYSFRLEIVSVIVENNIGGSAVARDLARVLTSDMKFKSLVRDWNICDKIG